MKKCILFFITALAFVSFMTAAGPVDASEPNIREGEWEITTKIEMEGMPSNMPQQEFVHTQCLTRDDYVPQGPKAGASSGSCEIRDVQSRGDSVTWTMQCNTGQGEMNGKGRITYSGDRFEGSIEAVMSGMKMTQQMEGRRIGDCR